MLWQQVMAIQIVASTALALWYKAVVIRFPRHIFATFLAVYCMVALAGIAISLVGLRGHVPPIPTDRAVLFIIGEGFFIPLSWLFAYRLLAIIGASSMAIAQSVSFLTTALFGIVLLDEPITSGLVIGAILLLTGAYMALSVKSSPREAQKKSIFHKIFLLTGGTFTLAIGLVFEKLAINAIGVWDYAFYGWMAQCLGASIIFVVFGRHELQRQRARIFWLYVLFAGALTALSGGLLIFALSKGMLSSVIVSSTAKIALTSVLAFWIFKERNNPLKRFAALALVLGGLFIVFM